MSTDARSPNLKFSANALPLELTEELKIRAQKELFEDRDRVTKSLELLRSLLKEEQDLRWQDDDLFLLAFLRARKFDIRRAFVLVKRFYTILGKHGDLFHARSLDDLRRTVGNAASILFYGDGEGAVINLNCFDKWDPDVITAEDCLVLTTFGILQALLSPATQIVGFHFIMDFKGFSVKHLMSLRPSTVRLFSEILQNSLPVRIRSIHAVNENQFFFYIWSIVRPFLSRKLTERIHVHGSDMKSLHKFFRPSILPADLGGELPPFDNTEWRESMAASADYVEHIRSFGYGKYVRKGWKKKSGERF